MINPENLSQLSAVPINEIKNGDFVVNLGKVVEIDKFPGHINLIVLRLNAKYVIKFNADSVIVIK